MTGGCVSKGPHFRVMAVLAFVSNFVHLLSLFIPLQEFETFIAKFGESGFVLVALGSMLNIAQFQKILKEMNSAFAHLPQGVIWKCNPSHWPKDVKLAANVKIVDWLPQNDLLGKDYPSVLLSFH